MNTVIIVGSARKNGNTHKVVNQLAKELSVDIIDLLDYQFSHFDYEHANRDDDFIPLIRKITNEYDTLIFATPVYWYAMSGLMKMFFDRITDLITIEKDLGRKLRGKKMAAVSSSGGNDLGDHFWLPFSSTADYLGMEYIGNMHTYEDKENTERVKEFVKNIQSY